MDQLPLDRREQPGARQALGQLPIVSSAAASWDGHQKRFVDASFASLPNAGVLPDSPKTADFATTVWPQNMQRALLGPNIARRHDAGDREALSRMMTTVQGALLLPWEKVAAGGGRMREKPDVSGSPHQSCYA